MSIHPSEQKESQNPKASTQQGIIVRFQRTRSAAFSLPKIPQCQKENNKKSFPVSYIGFFPKSARAEQIVLYSNLSAKRRPRRRHAPALAARSPS
jgi:hypothetical protein